MYFEYKLDVHFQRPVISIPNLNDMRVMIDCGALFSVWTLSERQLVEIGGIDQNHIVPFGGFGGKTQGNLYTLDLWLSEKSLLLKNLPIVVDNSISLNCPLILSTTSFESFEYKVNTRTKTFGIKTFDNQVVKLLAYRIKDNGSITVYVHNE